MCCEVLGICFTSCKCVINNNESSNMSMYCLHNNATYLFRKCAPLEKGKCFNKVSWERESIILSKTADVDN